MGKFSDKMEAIRRVDPKRASRILAILTFVVAGLMQISHILDRWDRPAGPAKPDAKLKLVRTIQPVYPPLAKQNRVQGTVRLAATVGSNGHVKELRLLDGNPMLVDAAMEAVEQWQYSPAISGGRPVDEKTEIDVNFRLDAPAAR